MVTFGCDKVKHTKVPLLATPLAGCINTSTTTMHKNSRLGQLKAFKQQAIRSAG